MCQNYANDIQGCHYADRSTQENRPAGKGKKENRPAKKKKKKEKKERKKKKLLC